METWQFNSYSKLNISETGLVSLVLIQSYIIPFVDK